MNETGRRGRAPAPPMKIATYNVNGVNGRLPRLLEWLEETRPDIVCLQEVKTSDGKFPARALEDAGYGAVWHGQPSHHGVAILARGDKPTERRRGLPGEPGDQQSRYLEAEIRGLVVASIYLPNGNPRPSPNFDYKLRWFERLIRHAGTLCALECPVVLAGDFNVVPTDADIYNAWLWRGDAVMQPEVRDAYRQLLGQGWLDAIPSLGRSERLYTFWVNAEAFRRGRGFRMDFLLLNPALHERLLDGGVDAWMRGRERASDHAPAWITLSPQAPRRRAAGTRPAAGSRI